MCDIAGLFAYQRASDPADRDRLNRLCQTMRQRDYKRREIEITGRLPVKRLYRPG